MYTYLCVTRTLLQWTKMCMPTFVLQGFDAMEQNAHAYLCIAIFLHLTIFTVRVKVITTTHNAKDHFENQANVTDMQLSNMSMQMG